jgi:serine O-acetyltransferase
VSSPASAVRLEPVAWSLPPVVNAICQANADLVPGRQGKLGRRSLPSREAVAGVASSLRAVLFPRHFGPSDVSEDGLAYYVGRTLDAALDTLERQVRVGLLFDCDHGGDDCEACSRRATAVTRELATRLPAIRMLLGGDARAAYEGDPAATSPDETVFSYAGMTAITYHRIAHELHVLGVPLVPRIISELAHAATGIDIHPGAQIGARFFIDHGTGVVIGETCIIGDHVRLYQGVTLGAKSFPTDDHGNPIKGLPRHPIIEDDVVIYAGANVLGRITIGRGSSIGGNVWLTESVPPRSHVSQARAHQELFGDGAGI